MKYCQKLQREGSRSGSFNQVTLMQSTMGLTSFDYQGVKPTNSSFFFDLFFFEGDQIEVKLETDPSF